VLLKSVTTNADGRTDDVLLSAAEMKVGKYAIEFDVAAYFRGLGHADAGKFLDVVRVDFVISDASAGYHVPLLVSPWAYSTYRGS
jgi:5-hydroxyisourate hydrolase